MTSLRFNCQFVFLMLTLSGCAASLPHFTEPARQTITEESLKELHYYLSSTISFRSLREIDTTSETGPFKPDLHRTLQVSAETPGRFVSGGEGWIKVDFGKGVLLTFTRNPNDGVYSMRGWGTFTIDGERYDLRVGVLSGEEVKLRYDAGAIQ